MTADDVKFSARPRARPRKTAKWAGMIGSIDTIEIATPHHHRAQAKHPDPTLIPALAMFNTGIFPKAKYEAAAGATEEEKHKAFAETPLAPGRS